MKLITASKNEYTALSSTASINYVTNRPLISISFDIDAITVEDIIDEISKDGFNEITIANDIVSKKYSGYKFVTGFSERITSSDATLLLILSTAAAEEETVNYAQLNA